MKVMIAIAALLLIPASLSLAGQIDSQRWEQAEREIRRVAPQDYGALPDGIASYLRRRGYTIPQTHARKEHHNVIRGHFDGDAVQDWAVLASRRGHSQILIFWGGSTARVTLLARQADATYLQTVADRGIGYSRIISVVGRDYILDQHHAYDGPEPPTIRHDAINDGFLEKASVVYYFDGVRWHRLQGAD